MPPHTLKGMWVWKNLGYNNVVELPSKALNALGRRCRYTEIRDETESCGTLRQDDPAHEQLTRMKDEDDAELELYPIGLLSGGMAASAYRLAKPEGARVAKLRLCIPGAVELKAAPSEIFHVRETNQNQRVMVNTLKDAITELVEVGGGVFTWDVPMVDARLRPDICDECRHTPAPEAFPLCVVGAVLGASLDIAVTLPHSSMSSPAGYRVGSPAAGNRSSPGSRSTTPEPKAWMPRDFELRDEPPVPCDGFVIQFIQRGGPALDPRRLSQTTTEEKADSRHIAAMKLAEELERWVTKGLAANPGTWTALHITSQEVDPKVLVSGFDAPALPAPGAATRRQTGDVVLAVAAETEVAMEPFVLSYGEANTAALRKMLEDEVAQALDIDNARVMCGDFMPLPRGKGSERKRHLRHDTIGLRFALLHSELTDVVKAQKPARQGSSSPPDSSGGKLPTGLARPPSRAQVEAASGMADRSMGKSASSKFTISGIPGMAQPKQAAAGKGRMKPSASAPALQKGIVQMPPMPSGEESDRPRDDTPPDLLLKRLRATLTDAKHPLRRHPDVFPMLSRIVGGLRSGSMLVVDLKELAPGKMAEGLKQLMKARTGMKRELEMDPAMRTSLNEMRADVLKIYKEPMGEVVAQQRQLTGLSAKELLDEMEGSVSRPTDLHASLRMLIVHTEKDVEWCLRLRSHKAVERVLTVGRRFNGERAVVCKIVSIISNLTLNDQGCVDKFIEMNLARDFILTLDNFPQDQEIQFRGCQTLRRLYFRARETASHGPRVICLGKNLPEVWTFKGLDRVLASMRLFGDNPEVQLECLTLLTSLGELLTNSGKAAETFTILEAVMRRHSSRPDILAKSVLMIARLGPVFLTYERKGIINILQAMAKHRSNVDLQRVATKALVSLSRDEKALLNIRGGGSIAAIVAAMGAHSKDEQVLREGAKALDKLCPEGFHQVGRICGDFATALPIISWHEFTHSNDFEVTTLDDKWEPRLVKAFREDMAMGRSRRPGTGASNAVVVHEEDEEGAGLTGSGLTTKRGFRRSGFREEFDGMDNNWATCSSVQSRSEAREKDIKVLKDRGCNAHHLRAPGPTTEMIKKLCELFSSGLDKGFSAPDGEFLASLIAHFAWCSPASTKDMLAAGAARSCAAWLDADRFRKSHPPEALALAVPMQRACLSALSCFCLHSEEFAIQVLNVEAPRLALLFTEHTDQRTQQVALRLLARVLPVSGTRGGTVADSGAMPRDAMWRFMLRELKERDDLRLREITRTCAAACALEAVQEGWVTDEVAAEARSQDVPKRVRELGEGLLAALQKAVKVKSAAAALPLLLTVWRLLSSPEVEDGHAAIKVLVTSDTSGDNGQKESGHTIVQMLAYWLPWAVVPGPPTPSAADRGAAVAAARALEAYLEYQPPKHFFNEMRQLLLTGQSTNAEPVLKEACNAALLKSVEKENQPQQLAHLFETSVGKGRDQEERLAEPRILKSIAERILALLKENPSLATDVLQRSLDRAQKLLSGPRIGPESREQEVLAVLGLITKVSSNSEAREASGDGAGSAGTDQEASDCESSHEHAQSEGAEFGKTAPPGRKFTDEGTPARDMAMTTPAVFSVG